MLVDSHCHLDFFKSPKQVVEKAIENGVGLMFSCSTNNESIKNHLKIGKSFKEIKICLGLHPVDILKMSEKELAKGIGLIKENVQKCVAVGEVGLDYKYAVNFTQKNLQEKIFHKQVEIALENDLPVVVHGRFAEQKTMALLKEEGAKRVLMHWFTNSLESIQMAKKFGYFMSVGPVILSSKQALLLAKKIPLKNLVLETDAPVSFFGKQSEPFWVKIVLEKLSVELGIKKEALEERTTENSFKLFGLE